MMLLIEGQFVNSLLPFPSISGFLPWEPARKPAGRAPFRKAMAAFTLAEVLAALAVLALTAVVITQAMLQLNRRAAISRVMNAAKAEALSRIEEVSQLSYSPDATPAVIPTLLNVGTTTTAVDLGSSATGLGSIPGTATWTVAKVANTDNTLSVNCTISYKYFNKNHSYALFTYKAPD
jgi:type II secretory pathway pseudopilin PulG